jgi:hypothetical protein
MATGKDGTVSAWELVSSVRNDNGYGYDSYETTGTYVGRGEFYSGARTGDSVRVARTVSYRPDGSVWRVSWSVNAGGASLSVSESDVLVPTA